MSAKELEPFWAVRFSNGDYRRAIPDGWTGSAEVADRFANLQEAYRDIVIRGRGTGEVVHVQPIPGKEQRRVISRNQMCRRVANGETVKVGLAEGAKVFDGDDFSAECLDNARLFDSETEATRYLAICPEVSVGLADWCCVEFVYVLLERGPTEYKETPASEILASMVEVPE